ncbi:MAG: hypothetical protein KY391_01570 [Actinobacteria bacterium]|nr:hypothetical protein [Actinomycetota bacterium]
MMELLPSPFATIAAWILTVTFAWAAVAKFVRRHSWAAAVGGFGFAGLGARVVRWGVPLTEVAIVALFAAGATRAGAASALALVASFSAAIVRTRGLRAADKVPCGCFGGSGESDYRLLLARNAALAVMAGVILVSRPAASLVEPFENELLPSALVVIGGALLVWMATEATSSLRRR